MKILIISQYFPPDITAAAYRIGDTYTLLKKSRHQIRVITTIPHKGGVDNISASHIDENHIKRIPIQPLERRTAFAHIEQYLNFTLKAFFEAMKLRKTFKYDVIWASSPPLFVALCTIMIRFLIRIPIVLDIRDLWPESAINIGKVRRGSLMDRLGRILELAAYHYSDALTCVSQPMATYLRKKTNRQVTVVYNGAPEKQLNYNYSSKPDPLCFCYAGNLGYAQGLPEVFKAFALACKYPEMNGVILKLIGAGAVLDESKKLCEDLGIADRIKFIGVRPKHEALKILGESGTLLIPLLDSPAFELTVPSKVFDYMGIERPIIACIRGEGKEILEVSGSNIVIPPGDIYKLAEAFVYAIKNWSVLLKCASKNKILVSCKFSREASVRELEHVLYFVSRTN